MLWNNIESAGMPGMAPQNSLEGEPASPPKPMPPKRLFRITGTGWRKPTESSREKPAPFQALIEPE